MNIATDIPAALDLRELSITYRGGVKAVDGVTLRVEQGEVVALLGPNGAGKTTLIDLTLGLAPPQTGSATLLGFSAAEAIRRGLVGVVNQTGALPMDDTVERTVALFHSLYRDALPVGMALERTNLTELRRRKVSKLSGGEQQRLRLALALLPRPLLLFLDEPTTGMDPVARQEFWRVMTGSGSGGATLVFATHYLAEAEAHAERTIIMDGGRIAADAPTAELLRRGNARLNVDLPQAARQRLEPALQRGDWTLSWRGDHLEIRGNALEDAARLVLAEPNCRNLRIADSSLEEIFSHIANHDRSAE